MNFIQSRWKNACLFLLYNFEYRHASCLLCSELSYSFLRSNQLPSTSMSWTILYAYIVMNCLKSCFHMKFFLPVTSGTSFICHSHLIVLMYANKFLSWVLTIYLSLLVLCGPFPQINYSIMPVTVYWNLVSALSHLVSFAPSSLLPVSSFDYPL